MSDHNGQAPDPPAGGSDHSVDVFVACDGTDDLFVLPTQTEPSTIGWLLGMPDDIDTQKASAARIYDYLLGGTHNLPVDREKAAILTELIPEVREGAWANRGFHQRAARWLAEQGIEQFLDLGSGLPTQNNTHDIVHTINPAAHVVYIDNDKAAKPLATRLLAEVPTSTFLSRDLREPDRILSDPDLHALIDLTKPVALLVTAVLHLMPDDADPWGLIAHYVDACAPGSYLALSHATSDHYERKLIDRVQAVYANTNQPFQPRTKQQIERF